MHSRATGTATLESTTQAIDLPQLAQQLLSVDDLDGVYFPDHDQYGIFPFTVAGTVSHEFFRKTAVTFDFATMHLIIATN